MSSNELARVDIPISDEVEKEQLRTYRQYLIDQHKEEGFLEVDGVGPDEDHPLFEARLLARKVGEVSLQRVLVIPVNENLQPWSMDLHDFDDRHEVLEHPYAYGSKRGLVPPGGDISTLRAA